ncbi:MAG TPA: DMT family transporter [Flavitalea sp.]|nr:DMT family transporter [Flavitalea sp.]
MKELRSGNWPLFILLCIIWGSSFILMKAGLNTLLPFQVASLRMLTAGIFLLPVAIQKISHFNLRKQLQMLLSGILGSFIPAYLFCIAETKIDSSLAGFLNALTPILTIIIGILFFGRSFEKKRWTGVLIGLLGMTILFFGRSPGEQSYLGYSSLVIASTILYAINLNFVGRHLQDVGSLTIVSIAFLYLSFPAAFILYLTGYFQLPFAETGILVSTGASTILGIFGTAMGTIFYYKLLKQSGPLFASLVTYGIPFVALAWGLIAGESVSLVELAGIAVILVGVYLANK